MQKSSFFKIVTIVIATATMPIMAMEITTTEKAQFIVMLSLHESSEQEINNKSLNTWDKHACDILRIKWQDNDNRYRTDSAVLINVNNTKEVWNWNFSHPLFLPLTTMPNPSRDKEIQHTVIFPKSLPTTFVEQLKKEKTITLTNTLFKTPVDIIITLDSIEDLETINKNRAELDNAINILKDFIAGKRDGILQEQSTTEVTTNTDDTKDTSTKIPQFTVTLDLREITQEDVEKPSSKRYDEGDKHACEVLGITWEDNNNTFLINYASFKRPNDTEYLCCWKNHHPKVLPLSKLPNADGEYKVTFPTSLPASFVKELEEKGTITLRGAHFVTPVEIIIQRGPIKKLAKTTVSNTATTLTQPKIEQQKNTTTNQPTVISSQSNVPKYILFGGCAISIVGFIAWLLHHNNRLDFSQITNFIHSLTSKK